MLKKINSFVRTRLPKGALWQAIVGSRRLMKQYPDDAVFRRVYKLNLRCYFHIGRNYHLMDYTERSESAPRVLYHVTAGCNRDSVMHDGLCNSKTGLVFLTNSCRYVEYFLGRKDEPLLLAVDVNELRLAGRKLYMNTYCPWMWITDTVPAQCISSAQYEEAKNNMI